MKYILLSDADAYFAKRLHTDAWDELGTGSDGITTRTKALNNAELIIDRLAYSVALPTSDTNTFSWLKDAICEIALSLLDGIDPARELEQLTSTGSTIANIKSTYDRSSAFEHILAGVPSPEAWRLLRPYLADAKSIRLVRSG